MFQIGTPPGERCGKGKEDAKESGSEKPRNNKPPTDAPATISESTIS